MCDEIYAMPLNTQKKCIDQSLHMPARSQNAYQHVFTKTLIFRRGHVLTELSPVSEDNLSNLVLSKHLLCEQGQKVSRFMLNNPFKASEDTE